MNLLLNIIRKLLFLLPRVILVSIFMFALFMTIVSNFDVLEPYLPPLNLVRGQVRQISPRVIAGPYPHIQELAGLKKKGVTVVISLLDPSLPQEKALLERELAAARRVGISVRNYGMGYLPVDSERNRKTREAILHSLKDEPGLIYVHCYLGRHRVTFVTDSLGKAAAAAGRKRY